MTSKRAATIPTLLLLALLVIALGAGLWQLFALRFEAGDNYPPYSTLRADPLGARVFHDALSLLPGLDVGRNLEPLRQLKDGAGTTLFILGLDPSDEAVWRSLIDINPNRELDRFVQEGGRLVVTLAPLNDKKKYVASVDGDFETSGTAWLRVHRKEENTTSTTQRKPTLWDRLTPWGDDPKTTRTLGRADDYDLPEISPMFADLRTSFAQLQAGPENTWSPAAARNATKLELPRVVYWYSSIYFSVAGKSWTPILARDGKPKMPEMPVLPVMIERRFGKGTIVLASDSYFVANEAMRDDRRPQLLSWLAGPNEKILFDETHLNVSQVPGMMGLARRYHLDGAVAVLFIISALTVWMNMSGLTPPMQEEREDALDLRGEAGRDAWTGMVDLIERNIDPGALPGMCLEEWSRSAPANRPGLERIKSQLRAVVAAQEAQPPRARNPILAYREMAKIIDREKRRVTTGSGGGAESTDALKIQNDRTDGSATP